MCPRRARALLLPSVSEGFSIGRRRNSFVCERLYGEFNLIGSHFWVDGVQLKYEFASCFSGRFVFLPTHGIQSELPCSGRVLMRAFVLSVCVCSARAPGLQRDAYEHTGPPCVFSCLYWVLKVIEHILPSPHGCYGNSKGCKNCVLRGADRLLAVIRAHFTKVFHRLFPSQNTRKPFHFFFSESSHAIAALLVWSD